MRVLAIFASLMAALAFAQAAGDVTSLQIGVKVSSRYGKQPKTCGGRAQQPGLFAVTPPAGLEYRAPAAEPARRMD